MIRRVLAVLAASIALSGATASAALAEYPPSDGSGAVSATTVSAGGHVVFTGGGFEPGSDVTISVNDAVYATSTANVVETAALSRSSSVHVTTAAYVRNAATVTAGATSAFSVEVTLQTVGANVLTGTGVDPSGATRVVTAKVTVHEATGTPAVDKGSNLPFTGGSVVLPGVIVGLAMLGGGFLLLTTVRSRRATS
jgi:hypothetical protein